MSGRRADGTYLWSLEAFFLRRFSMYLSSRPADLSSSYLANSSRLRFSDFLRKKGFFPAATAAFSSAYRADKVAKQADFYCQLVAESGNCRWLPEQPKPHNTFTAPPPRAWSTLTEN